jgi:hypothetical protein
VLHLNDLGKYGTAERLQVATSQGLEGGTPPGILYEYQKKEVVKFDCCNCVKRKRETFWGCERGEFQNGKNGLECERLRREEEVGEAFRQLRNLRS